jgi:RNA polymerase sigma-70 factor (ECF subfamily)
MTEPRQWQPERYRALLRLQVRQMHLSPRLHRRFDSSDVVQDALLKAVKELPHCRAQNEGEFVCWLQQILENAALDCVRRENAQKRDPALEQSIHDAIAESSASWGKVLGDGRLPPDKEAERREMMLRFAEAVDQLPEDQRDVVICRNQSGLPVAEIAARLGRSERSVAGLLLRGLKRLRKLLPDYEP